MNATEAAELIGVARKTIYDWCEKKILPATPIGKGWDIKREDALKRALEIGKKKSPAEKPVVQQAEKVAPVAIEEVPLATSRLPDRGMSRYEAERIVKIEDAIRKHRENLLEDGKLVLADEVSSDLQEIFRIVWNDMREYLDKIAVDCNLSPDQGKKNQFEFNKMLTVALEKAKSLCKKSS